ncbi:MAG TPA: hypothetical protein VFG31_08840 [Conexibacter sp.]|nr:hypothetical protein [Conexibacter sp.]
MPPLHRHLTAWLRATIAAHTGQAAVELVATLPLLVAVALGILQALAAGVAVELAGHAAQSGAVAIAEGRDGEAAARAALPGWARSRLRVEVHGSRVQVRVTPPALLPGVAARLTASAAADAGAGR